MDFLKKLWENFKAGDKNKFITNLVILVMVGILIMVLSNTFKTPSLAVSKTQNNTNVKEGSTGSLESVTKEYEQARKVELTNLLESMEGVGRVEVAVYCEAGEEQVPAENTNTSNSVTNEKAQEGDTRTTTQQTSGSTVVMSNQGGENSALIVKKLNPKVTGVCIVAEGADVEVTQLRIKLAVMKLFKLTEDQVTVLSMKK